MKTPNPKEEKAWDSQFEEGKGSNKPAKIRHSKNSSMIGGNTPYSIFLNVQPNISIIKGRRRVINFKDNKAKMRKSYIKAKGKI